MRDELSGDSVSSSRRGCGRRRSSALWRLSAPQRLELQPGIARRGAVRGADRPGPQPVRALHAQLHRTPPSPGLPVCLSLPRGVTAGGNHGVRSRYTRTLLFHLVSRRGVGKRRERVGREGLYLNAHLCVWELQSVREGRESAPVWSFRPSPQSCSIYPLTISSHHPVAVLPA